MNQSINRIAVLQPSYLPWIGYFEQIDYVNHFVFYDDVQYTTRDWRNRNKIIASKSTMWLSVPVRGGQNQKLCDVVIDNTQRWRQKHLSALKHNYQKAPYFEEVYPLLESVLDRRYDKLCDLNADIIRLFMKYLNIQTHLYFSSQLGIEGDKNSRLVNLSSYFNACEYYTGASAKNYLEIELFQEKNIDVKFQNYQIVDYPQFLKTFDPYVSIVDLLFMCGTESLKIIRGTHG